MSKTIKVAISMRNEDFKVIEVIRKQEGSTRSGVIAKAIRLLADKIEEEKMIREYETGYKKHPEKPSDIKAMEKAAIETLSVEVW